MDHQGKEKRLQKILIEMEEIIGGLCYNSNMQNYGPGGEWEGEGREFRYPLSFVDSSGITRKSHVLFEKFMEEADLKNYSLNGHYKFGANQLMIMQGLRNVVKHLENNYGFEL
ncbi:hypothetical protein [Alcanivorax sp.]|jgi:hypothetical protein|uniref:hypothetical protein n=1 Tax=Alcanivorax sp. TaxID=1872427 RepID=UPI0025C551B7|nr:hypothetical protein [Alcanivorax sp.]